MTPTATAALEELSTLGPAEEAHDHPVLGKIWRTASAAATAAKRRHANGLADAGAALLINHRLYFHPENTAAWALKRQP